MKKVLAVVALVCVGLFAGGACAQTPASSAEQEIRPLLAKMGKAAGARDADAFMAFMLRRPCRVAQTLIFISTSTPMKRLATCMVGLIPSFVAASASVAGGGVMKSLSRVGRNRRSRFRQGSTGGNRSAETARGFRPTCCQPRDAGASRDVFVE
ncbi:MAG: hypothetical protein ACREPZ_01290 [Rhodanobacteraceae bacterium]